MISDGLTAGVMAFDRRHLTFAWTILDFTLWRDFGCPVDDIHMQGFHHPQSRDICNA